MADSETVHVLDEFLKDMDELECQQGKKLLDRHRRVMKDPRKKTIPSWLRRKQELIALRLQSQEMETRVQFLKLQQDRRRCELSISQKQLKELVDKEKRRRQQAERENEALKSQLQAYIWLSSEFQAAIVKAQADQTSLDNVIPTMAFCAAMKTRSIHQLQISSIATFNMLEERVDKRFQAVQTILDEIQHSSVALDEEQVQFDRGKNVMEYKCARVLPFDENATFNAAWSIVEEGGATQKQASHVVRRSNDAYAVDSRFAMPLDHGELVKVDVHCVIKRFVVPEGVLLLAEAASEWSAHHGASTLWSEESCESMWCVVRGINQEPVCQLKAVACSEAVRQQVAHGSRDTKWVCTHDRAIFSFRELINSQRQFLENMLWDSTRNTEKHDL